MYEEKRGVRHLSEIKKTVLCVLTGALAATSLIVVPLAGASTSPDKAAASGAVARAQEVVAVPVPVTKGIQTLVRLLPELSARHVVYVGDVDGPGVSGAKVSFALSAAEANKAVDGAIFDSATGNLLKLELAPKAATKPAFPTEQQAKARAQAFVAGLAASGSTYQAREVTNAGGKLTVRLVRKVNNVALDDAYDNFVSFDAAGRIIAFETFDGRLYEKINPATLPSAQRVLSPAQALTQWKASRPLELVYLLPEQDQPNRTEAKLAYIVKGGIIANEHTGSAVDAASGKKLAAPDKLPQILNVTGTGEKWTAQTEKEARNLLRILFKLETARLPMTILEEKHDNGEAVRYFIWGHFQKDATDQDKKYQIGQFPEGVSKAEGQHIMLVTDAKTGQMQQFIYRQANEPGAAAKTDKNRDRKTVEMLLKRLVLSGSNQLRVTDIGDEKYTSLALDPLLGNVPVYRIGQSEEAGMYTVKVNSWTGKIEEVSINRPENVVYPASSKAIKEQAAMDRLLGVLPLELNYIHQRDAQTNAITFKLGYDLSFRQTRSHCFCGANAKIDTTVYVDALTGQTIIKE
ncbi:hypothetical protein M2298_002784 [Brevibacillus sp. 1238]|nr:hypothetical protein [Brevibacillus sp. 1238]